ncbi:MAG: NADH-quinone oxidoreductase subunit C, partial [Bdellovibrionales bacterium]|nr:NADH-quinone oxidoreductase subunit C [Bdellovibrionales bacterium]
MSLDITENLKKDFQSRFPGSTFNYLYAFGNSVVQVEPSEVVPLLKHLKDTGRFDFLMNISGVDYPDRKKRFEVAYELFCSRNAQRLRIKTQVADGESVPTATGVWKGADWFEREIFDMYGVKFEGHLNMRRL